MDEHDRQVLLALYDRSSRIAETFWEWRYKLLMLVIGGSSALVALTATLATSFPEHPVVIALPAIAGGIFAFAVALLDWRNAEILSDAYSVLVPFERELLVTAGFSGPGIFAHLSRYVCEKPSGAMTPSWKRLRRYSVVVPGLALLMSATCFVTAGLVIHG